MALTDILKNKKSAPAKKEKAAKRESAPSIPSGVSSRVSHVVIKRPRITEKAALLAEKNTYAFEIDARANKIEIKRAIKEIYGVDAVSVNVVHTPTKNVVVRGKRGTKAAIHKAYVVLKKGDVIEFA